jgi:hypothetical protein
MARIRLALLAATATIASEAGGQTRPALDLVTHSEVTIDRRAAVIWPLIVDPSGWKQGLVLSHHSGPRGEAGEVFAARARDDTTIAFFVENVELEAARRRTIKLYSPTGTLLGFATWTLEERGGKTAVRYDVYSESLVTSEQAAALGAEELRRQASANLATNKSRFDAELLALKRLVER